MVDSPANGADTREIIESLGFLKSPVSWLPSGYVKIAIENGPVEIVDLPFQNGDFPWLC